MRLVSTEVYSLRGETGVLVTEINGLSKELCYF
jgi:hypothetical protein